MNKIGLSLLVVLVVACTQNSEKYKKVSTMTQPKLLIEKVSSQLEKAKEMQEYNAFIYLANESAINRAKEISHLTDLSQLPLAGLTLAIKDNIEVKGMPHTLGHKLLTHYIPETDAEVVARVKNAGAIVIGKANMHEIAYGVTSNNPVFGAVANAYNPTKFSGGSSGGTAVAIALGLADAGLGSDTGGSVRIPAALNGIVGFRPTTGRYSNDGLSMISTTRDTVGPMAKDVKTVALLDAVLSGQDEPLLLPEANKLRFGVPRALFYEDLSTDVSDSMEKALSQLSAAGIELVMVDLVDESALSEQIGFPVVLYETNQLIPQFLKQNIPNLSMQDFIKGISSPDVKAIFQMIVEQPIAEDVYKKSINVLRPQLQAGYRQYFERNKLDAMIVPATPLAAQDIEGTEQNVTLNGRQVPTFATFIRNTDLASNAGFPSLVIPIGKNSEGMPIAAQIEGPINSDRQLLAIGSLIEYLIKQ